MRKRRRAEVLHADQESNYKKTFLAKDFENFIRGLVCEETYDTYADFFGHWFDERVKSKQIVLTRPFLKGMNIVPPKQTR